MKKLIAVILFAILLTAYVQADSPSMTQPIDMSILPGDPDQRELWLQAVRKRFCYPPGDTNCDGRVNPVDVVLMIRQVYLSHSFPECR